LIGDDWNQELGYGIYVGGTSHGADYSYILVVDWSKREVLVCDNDNSDRVIEAISFDDFISNHEVLVPNSTMSLDAEKHAAFIAKYPELAKLSS
jgi:hypothetical protein